MRPTRIRDKKMELFDRAKTILFKPKEEWTIIEAENAPHAKVFTGYLLILALIPAVAIFVQEWWTWHSFYTEYLGKLGELNPDVVSKAKELYPFNTKWSIIHAACPFVAIVGGAYIAAAAINALSNQFGSEKDFNRAFALAAYSFTPLCIAGILYISSSLAWLVPYAGLYGVYLLYLGAVPQLKPADDKKTSCFMISIIVVLAAWMILEKAVIPEVIKQVKIAEVKAAYKKASGGQDIDYKDIEKYIRKY